MTLNSAASRMSGELRNLMNITEQALRRGYRENATKPKASSTRQSERRVRLPTMSHTTGKDSTVLFPLTHQQPQPPFLVSWGNLSPPPSSPFGPSFYVNHLQIKIRSHDASSPPFQIVCQSFKNIRSPSHPLTHCCWAGRCCGDAEARRCSEKWSFLKPNKQLWGSHCETLPVAVAAPADDISKGDTVIYIPTSLWFLFLS